MTVLVQPRRRNSRMRLITMAIIVAAVVDLLLFSVLARLLATPAASPLPPLVTLTRQAPPPAEPPPPPPPLQQPVSPAPPPALPTLDLGTISTPFALPQSDMPLLAPLPTLMPTTLGTVDLGGIGVMPAAPVVLDDGQAEQDARPLNRHNPEFPERAERFGLTDTVVVSFIVGVDGTTRDVQVVSSRHPDFFNAPSIECVRSTRFSPGRKDGQAVAVRKIWTIRYVLPDRP